MNTVVMATLLLNTLFVFLSLPPSLPPSLLSLPLSPSPSGGVSEHETLGNVECYDPETNRWVVDLIPQMNYRRSGVGKRESVCMCMQLIVFYFLKELLCCKVYCLLLVGILKGRQVLML